MAQRSPRHRSAHSASKPRAPDWSELLVEAVTRPGVVSDAYHHFHSYSPSNQLIALFTCLARRIEPGPICTFKGWQRLGRQVRKGEKAIELCMPVMWKGKADQKEEPKPREDPPDFQPAVIRRRFIFRRNWFVLSQTDGDPYVPVAIPEWTEGLALQALGIERVPFTHTDGNCMGYASGRSVAVSPLAYLPARTIFHEMAHVLLGHTAEAGLFDGSERTPRDIREVEAEAVAYLCSESLRMAGGEFSRGYLQHWLGSKSIEDRSAQRIFHAADLILKAGRPKPTEEEPSDEASDPPE